MKLKMEHWCLLKPGVLITGMSKFPVDHTSLCRKNEGFHEEFLQQM